MAPDKTGSRHNVILSHFSYQANDGKGKAVSFTRPVPFTAFSSVILSSNLMFRLEGTGSSDRLPFIKIGLLKVPL